MTVAADIPPFRYTAALAAEIERRWQDRWERAGHVQRAQPDRAAGGRRTVRRAGGEALPAGHVPYPSGEGLHVGHPLGYIGTDVLGRFQRMTGRNVLHTMGFDAFGLPAEQYAVQTGTHPRTTTEANIASYRAPAAPAGPGPRPAAAASPPPTWSSTAGPSGSSCRSSTPGTTRTADAARPIAALVDEFAAGTRADPGRRAWAELTPAEQQRVVDGYRLAYIAEAPVNWCPGLGTVLANEEVTADGRSDSGNFPVFRRNLRQWMMRITAYADRLIDDLDRLDWPESVKAMQRNWIGRSTGAQVRLPGRCAGGSARTAARAMPIEVFTTRPDTLFGATYMVLAPEHPLVDAIAAAGWPAGTDRRWTGGAATPGRGGRRLPAGRGPQVRPGPPGEPGEDRRLHRRVRHEPGQRRPIPVFVADYVLMGYGTGAIMAVPGQDTRDWDFAEAFGLPIIRTVQPTADHRRDEAYTGDGPAINSPTARSRWTAWASPTAKATIIDWLAEQGLRPGAGAVQAAGLAVLPAAVLGRAVPDRLRRGRPADRAARRPAAGRAARGGRLLAADVRPATTRPRAGAAAGPRRPSGRTSSWTWATARSATAANRT